MISETSKVDVSGFVLYKSPQGNSYHRKPTCATQVDIPPTLDGANDLFNDLQMYRVHEVDLTDGNLCSTCSQNLRNVLEL